MVEPSWVRSLLEKQAERIVFDTDLHSYAVDGVPLANVSSIANTLDKGALLNWAGGRAVAAAVAAVQAWDGTDRSQLEYAVASAKGVWDRESKASQVFGTEVHALIEYHGKRSMGIMVRPPIVSKEARECFESSWLPWAEDVGYEPIICEARLHHPLELFAGTCDAVGKTKEYPLIVPDWKTKDPGKEKYKPYTAQRLQNIGYQGALKYWGIEDAIGMIVNIPRTGGGKPRAFPVYWDDRDWDAFRHLRAVYSWLKDIER